MIVCDMRLDPMPAIRAMCTGFGCSLRKISAVSLGEQQRMNTMKCIARKFAYGIAAAVCCFAFSGCDYDVPITASPTRKVDERLLGDWVSSSSDRKETMKVRRLDDFIYIVSYNGEWFRAYHSDVAGTSFVSAQEIETAERKYAYLAWRLSEDGRQLGLRVVRNKVISKESKDSAVVQKLLAENLQNAALLEDENQFTRAK
jgi:hypothetical protein